MNKLRLSLACWDYDRTRALADGSVPVDGVELNYLNLHVEETFFRMLRHREFDVAEMSISETLLAFERRDGTRWDMASRRATISGSTGARKALSRARECEATHGVLSLKVWRSSCTA